MQEEYDREDLDDAVDLAHRLDLIPLVRDEARPPDGDGTLRGGVDLHVCGLGRLAARPLPVDQEHIHGHLGDVMAVPGDYSKHNVTVCNGGGDFSTRYQPV